MTATVVDTALDTGLSASSYTQGEVVRITCTFKDATGALADPSVITAIVKSPTTKTSYVVAAGKIVRVSLGVYTLDLTTNANGEWSYRFVGTGTLAAAVEGAFFIQSAVIG